jgi:hypothetical protein
LIDNEVCIIAFYQSLENAVHHPTLGPKSINFRFQILLDGFQVRVVRAD